jgi:hypothetical protein
LISISFTKSQKKSYPQLKGMNPMYAPEIKLFQNDEIVQAISPTGQKNL